MYQRYSFAKRTECRADLRGAHGFLKRKWVPRDRSQKVGYYFLVRILSALLLSTFITGCVTALPTEIKAKVTASPSSVQQGDTVLIQFSTQTQGVTLLVGESNPSNDGKNAKLVNRPRVFVCPNGFCALVGVGLDYPIGKLSIALNGPDGKMLDSTTVLVRASEKPTERLSVDPSRVKISKRDQRRIDEEKKIVHAALNSPRSEALESFAFQLPVQSKATGAFGRKRIFNGQPRGYHTGVDLRASLGTEIRSANSGMVRLARSLFMAGGQVLLDHGGGIFSSYSHLSKILVKEGQRVSAGEILGKAGATGRVTAPHLHWTVRVEGEAIDPLQFLEILEPLSRTEKSSVTKVEP